ncbi:esterase FE4-like [Trichoplusia ni]|uniref:Esterase FE4-like n=1 Tax=Trichoplusia ni TaxID=7111 RepID=A0A7E5WQT4_TRINI|nr:esterase FE4-like [Trichoplusia ni]
MFRLILFLVFVTNVFCEDSRVVMLDIGGVSGEKFWDGDYYEFFGIPYATVPKGRDRYKAPLPVEPWEGVMGAQTRNIACQQVYLTEEEDEEVILDGVEECLTMNIFVPKIASEENLVPVLVYIHSGAFSGGSGNMGRFNYLARHDVVVVSFNYRLGAIGFACLGTEDIPGNAAMKDQVAALKFINKYISKFGGDPNKVTLAGFSVGASMAELLALSKSAGHLIDKLILESGSALSPFAVDRTPVNTARNLAISIGFNSTGTLEELNEFLLNANITDLAVESKKFFLTNSTFGIAPCVEREIENVEPFMTEPPLITLHRGDYKQLPILTGFSNMEGISRTIKLYDWMDMMNEDFSVFLPADLKIDDKKARDDLIADIRKLYFKGEEVSFDTLQGYVDYFSDSMFKYAIMKSARLHSVKSDMPVFLYEFSYVGKLNFKHHYMDKLKGASHRDQTAYLIDFYEHTTRLKDFDTRDRLTTMWTDFVKYEDPTAYESLLIDLKWKRYTIKDPNYMEISHKLKLKKDLFAKRFQFWDKVYDKHYWNPNPPVIKSENKKA